MRVSGYQMAALSLCLNVLTSSSVAQAKECPSGTFKTTGTWRGCSCHAGRHKEYQDIFKYKAKCISDRPFCYHFVSRGDHCYGLYEKHYGCTQSGQEVSWSDACIGYFEAYFLGVQACFDEPKSTEKGCREGYSVKKAGHIFP